MSVFLNTGFINRKLSLISKRKWVKSRCRSRMLVNIQIWKNRWGIFCWWGILYFSQFLS